MSCPLHLNNIATSPRCRLSQKRLILIYFTCNLSLNRVLMAGAGWKSGVVKRGGALCSYGIADKITIGRLGETTHIKFLTLQYHIVNFSL